MKVIKAQSNQDLHLHSGDNPPSQPVLPESQQSGESPPSNPTDDVSIQSGNIPFSDPIPSEPTQGGKTPPSTPKQFIFRVPPKDDFVTIISNDVFKKYFDSNTAKLLLMHVLAENNDFDYTVAWGEGELKMDKKTILKAEEYLIQHGYLTKIKINGNTNEYYWYESPSINPEYQHRLKTEKAEGDKEKDAENDDEEEEEEMAPRRKVSKGRTVQSRVKRQINKLENVQSALLNLVNEIPVLDVIHKIQSEIDNLHDIIKNLGDDEPEDE